jgi:rhomboid family GlyGly-CTERM serine protease
MSLAAALPGWTALRYDRGAIAQGELWRLVTGHFAHLGPAHLALNLAGLALVWFLVGGAWTALQWSFIAAFAIASIDLGFWFLDQDLAWYVGMSGVLHAFLSAGILRQLRNMPVELGALGMLLVAKIVYEQVAGPLPGSRESVGGDVVVNAHLYGVIAGALGGLLVTAANRAGMVSERRREQ